MANIELPKDAEGREIPLDTKVLYNRDGDIYEVAFYIYVVHQTIPMRIWNAKMLDGTIRYTTSLYLTPPDTWEKLEEDLGRAAERDVVSTGCRYFNATNKCNGCPLYGSVNCDVHRDESAFADIIKRIRKLRGEDE